MTGKKHFIQDRSALLLVSTNAFLALAAVVLISLKLNASKGTVNYIVSYRASLGIDSYAQGTFWDIMSFIVAAALILTLSVLLAVRTYHIKRELSMAVLILTFPLLVLLIIVTNALLILR